MEIMRTEHNFTATERSYKRRVAEWGWRKNIQVQDGVDDRAVHEALKSRYVAATDPSTEPPQPPQQNHKTTTTKRSHVRLASGQLVDVDRLAQHVRRKCARASGAEQHRAQQDAAPAHAHTQHAIQLPWTVRTPEALRLYEVIFVHSRSYTYGRHDNVSDIRSAAAVLSRDKLAAHRWGQFATSVQAALAEQNLHEALVRMRAAPEEVATIIATQPSNILCSFFMFVLQISCWRAADACAVRQFWALLKALFRYGATLARAEGLRGEHPLMQVLQNLASVPDEEMSEVAFRAWAVTCQAWGTLVSLEGNSSPAVPAACIQRWLDYGDKGDMMEVMFNFLDETLKTCDAEHGKTDQRGIKVLYTKTELLTWLLNEQGLDCYTNPSLLLLYQEILDRGAQGQIMGAALDFLAKGREGLGISPDLPSPLIAV